MDLRIRNAALSLSAADHADIFRQLLKIDEKHGTIFAASDLHEDGITSLFSEMRPMIEGAVKLSNYTVFAGTDSEYESNADVIKCVRDIEDAFKQEAKRGIHRSKKDKHEYLVEEVQKLLLKKVEDDVAWRTSLATENPGTHFVEVGGNHSNFASFREGMQKLSDDAIAPNYRFGLELAAIRLGKNKDGSLVIVTHSHHQLDDAGVVADGFTDKQMGFLTLREMVEKAIGIAKAEATSDTNLEWAVKKFNSLMPDLSPRAVAKFAGEFFSDPMGSLRRGMVKTVEAFITPRAELQEQWQGLVTFLRKPVSTARKIHRDLGYRAVLGSVLEQIEHGEDGGKIDTGDLENQLKKRIAKIDRKLEELPEKGLGLSEREGRRSAYAEEKKTLERHLYKIDQAKALLEKDGAHPDDLSWLQKRVLHVISPEDGKPVLFTLEHFNQMNKLISGHTHVPSTGVWIDREAGSHVSDKEDREIRATEYINLGSTTERILTNKYGQKGAGKPVDIKLENIGAALSVYDLETGKIERTVSIGNLIAQNLEQYQALVVEKAGLNKAQEEAVAKAQTVEESRRAEEVREKFEKFRASRDARSWAGRH